MGRSTQWWVCSTPELHHRHQYWQWDEHISKKSWHYGSALGSPQKWRCDKEISLWKKGHIIEVFFSPTRKCQEALLRIQLSVPSSLWALELSSSERKAGNSSKGSYSPSHSLILGSGLAVSPTQPCMSPDSAIRHLLELLKCFAVSDRYPFHQKCSPHHPFRMTLRSGEKNAGGL